MKYLSRLWSWAYASWLKNRWLGRGVGISTYLGGAAYIWELLAPSLSPCGVGGVPGGGGVSSGGGAPSPLCLQCACRFIAGPFGQWREPSVWFSWTISGCLSIAAFTLLCVGNSTPCFVSSQTLVQAVLIRNCISSIAASEKPPLAILAIFKPRHMADCSSHTRPPYPAIVADMLKTYNKLVPASKNGTQVLPLPYTIP